LSEKHDVRHGTTTTTTGLTINKQLTKPNAQGNPSCLTPSIKAAIPRSISFDITLLRQLDEKCLSLGLKRSAVINKLIRQWLETEKPQDTAQASEPSTKNPDKYLTDLKRQWPQLSPDQRAKHQTYVVRTYGPEGQAFLRSLGGP